MQILCYRKDRKVGKEIKMLGRGVGRILSWVGEYTPLYKSLLPQMFINCKTCFFFAHVYFSRFEFHSRKIQDRKDFNVDYFYRFRPFFVYFGCFSGVCLLMSSLLLALSRTIHARENFGWPFANNRRARHIPVLQYHPPPKYG